MTPTPQRIVGDTVSGNFVMSLPVTHCEEEDRCLHVALPVAAFIEMVPKYVTMRATTATRAGCVHRGMDRTTPFSGRGDRNAAEDDPRPNILQLNTEGLTENNTSA